MKKTILYLSLVLSSLLVAPASAETLLNLKFGPAWPRMVYEDFPRGNRTAWDGTFQVGGLINRIVGIGGAADFQWHTFTSDSTTRDSLQRQIVNREEQTFMFPLSLFLSIDPVPDLIVHPVVSGQIGFNMMTYNNRAYDTSGSEHDSPTNGFYIGIFGRVTAEALYDVGKNVSVLLGFDYQFSELSHQIQGHANQYYQKNMIGPGLHTGFRFAL